MVATVFATIIGGGSASDVTENTFRVGVLCLGMNCVSFFNISILIADVVAPRVAKFSKMISIGGDIMECFYVRRGCIISRIKASMVSIGIACIQVYAIGNMIRYLTGITEF